MKALPFKIPKKPKENIILQVDKGPSFYDKLHQHGEIQLSYILSGKGKLVVGNSVSTFNAGDFIAIGSNLPHLFLSHLDSGPAHMLSIFFTQNSFGETFFENQEMQGLKPVIDCFPFGFKFQEKEAFIKNLFLELKNEDKFQLFIKLLELLNYLKRVKKVPLIGNAYAFKVNKDQGQRLQVVFDYVMQNFHTDVTLEHIAKKVHMSKNAFCRFFKQRTNKTFFQFLAEIRIQHACQLLQEQPDTSVLEIANLSGYHTISNFNRQFREIKEMSPSNYRMISMASV